MTIPASVEKIFAYVGFGVILVALGYMIYNQEKIKTQQVALQTAVTQQQTLVDGITRASSTYATKDDIAAFAAVQNLNLQAIQDNLAKLGAQVGSITVTTVDSTGQTQTNLPSTGTGPDNPNPPTPVTVNCPSGGTVTCPTTIDPYGYQQKEQTLTLNEDLGTLKVPIGTVGFSAFQAAPWNINVLPRVYTVDTVVGVDQNQKETIYSKVNISVGGQTYTAPIQASTTKQELPTATFSWWNPRLLMGLDGGINITRFGGEFTPSINLGIASYGQFKSTPDWSILEVGVGYETVSRNVQFSVTPVAYNFGKNFFSPLANNTYLGPVVSVNTIGNIGVGLGLRIGF
jgi:hypothetical protein